MAYTSANPGRAVAAGGVSLDRALRKLFPSTSKLTFNPVFRSAVNAFDIVPRLVFPEYRALPPNHLRIRIGVGNRIFNNQSHFLVHARDFWMFVFAEGIATMRSDILDIGVGCGRWAHWLRDYNFRGRRFGGTYVGIDIDEGSDRLVPEKLRRRAVPFPRFERHQRVVQSHRRRRPIGLSRAARGRLVRPGLFQFAAVASARSRARKTICASPIGS